MEKQEKAMLAHPNSQRLKAQTPDYTAVDGRVYRLDKKLPSGKPNMRTCAIRVMRDRPSLMDVYRIEHWLSGKGRYGKSYVPAAEKERIIAEYGLSFSQQLQRYTASEEKLWELFLERFGAQIQEKHIESYGELMNKAKFRT